MLEVMKMREEEKKQSSRKIGMKNFFKKKWVFPAIYIGAAAILLTTFLVWQMRAPENVEQPDFSYEENAQRQMDDEDALEVGKTVEDFSWPVKNEDDVEIVTYFYDATASEEEQEAAIIYDGNSFYPSTGIAIAAKNGETFDVQAAMSGSVKSVKEDTVLGNVVVVEHAKGIETVYQSLQEVNVSEGDKVKQGDVLGKAGRSLINEEAGVHAHFEIRKNDVPVNPLDYFKKSLTTLQNQELNEDDQANEEAAEEAKEQDEAGTSEEDTSDEENRDANENEQE
jgi:stage II sporulation protein Q